MAVEIERKFLLKDDSWQQEVEKTVAMRQGYFAPPRKASIRVRVAGEQANLNIKSATLGVMRKEYEIPIPVADAHEMLDQLCETPIIEKKRHYIRKGTHTWEIDEFEGDNAGLVVAEIELSAEDEVFDKPSWVGEEVSHDKRYYNVSLVTHPYKDW